MFQDYPHNFTPHPPRPIYPNHALISEPLRKCVCEHRRAFSRERNEILQFKTLMCLHSQICISRILKDNVSLKHGVLVLLFM